MNSQTQKKIEDGVPVAEQWFPKSSRRRMLIGLLLAMGGISMLMWRNFKLQQQIQHAEKIAVLVVNQDLKPGERIRSRSLSVAEIPSVYMHDKLVLAELKELVLGKVLRDPTQAGEPLLWNALAAENQQTTRMAGMVRKGERAVAIRVDGISSVGYFVSPGDRVDIFLATQRHGGRVVIPVLQNVSVLATNNVVAGATPINSYNRIIVSVTPQEAEMLLLAQQAGKIFLLLRNEDDISAEADFPVLEEAEFLGTDLRKNVQKQRNKRVIKVIRGSG